MKKAHILILVVAVSVILLVISIWAIAYSYFSSRIDNSTRQSFVDETISFLSTDEEFINQYGLLISIESKDKSPIKNESSEQTEYYMDFSCVTENGACDIRVYHTFGDKWTYRFEENNHDDS